jgi:hypothetical protein
MAQILFRTPFYAVDEQLSALPLHAIPLFHLLLLQFLFHRLPLFRLILLRLFVRLKLCQRAEKPEHALVARRARRSAGAQLLLRDIVLA